MAKSTYGEKRKRGLVPAQYPARMLGAWPHWGNATNRQREDFGRKETASNFRDRGYHKFVEHYRGYPYETSVVNMLRGPAW